MQVDSRGNDACTSCQLRNENDVLHSTVCAVREEIGTSYCPREDLSQYGCRMWAGKSETRKKGLEAKV